MRAQDLLAYNPIQSEKASKSEQIGEHTRPRRTISWWIGWFLLFLLADKKELNHGH